MAIVIAVLLWQTTWLSLRPGLLILLIGQISAAAVFFAHRSAIGGTGSCLRMLTWFDGEERFVSFSALVESVFRVVGFVVLAYGFWTATHILWITLILGIVYPLFSYFGVARRNTRQMLNTISRQRNELEQFPD